MIAICLVMVAVAAAGFWAGRIALAPPADPLAGASEPVTYRVIEQTVGQSLQFAAVAEWETSPLVRGWGSGVVTSIEFTDGDTVAAGDVLFTVNLRPAVIAAGDVPAFRDLAVGTTGRDVAQLESLLGELGHLSEAPDDVFDESTADAVRDWQKALGVPSDGIVLQGDVLFTPDLPVRVLGSDALSVGAPLVAGEVVVHALGSAPAITIPLTPDQRNLVPLSGSVRVAYPGGTWDAVISRARESNEQGIEQVDLVLEAATGGPACGDGCELWIPPDGRTSFAADLVVVPEETGPVIPVAAVRSDPGGNRWVLLADGREVRISVLASTAGLAVVSGLQPGDLIVLPLADPGG